MIQTLLIAITRLCCGIIIRNENNDFKQANVVYYANHTSHFDLLVVLSALKRPQRRNLHPIAAKEYWGKNWIRRFISLHVLDAIFIDRRHPQRAKQTFNVIHDKLNAGQSILVFPEGTRHETDVHPEFHNGIYLIAKMRPETLFIPIYLKGFDRTLPKGEYLPAPNMGEITFRQGLQILPNDTKQTFTERCRLALYGKTNIYKDYYALISRR